MEMVDSPMKEREICNSCPRGGPIYVPNLVSPFTSVLEFEASVVEELQSLEAELCGDSAQPCIDELSIDELKVFTEEELVDKAFKEAFKDAQQSEHSSRLSEEPSNGMRMDDPTIPTVSSNEISESNFLESSKSSNSSHVDTHYKDHSEKNAQHEPKKKKKRGRVFDRDSRAAELESSCTATVKQLAKIKRQQDEDKLAARLHSFNGSAMIIERPISTSEKIERMRSLRFITSVMKVKSSSTQEHVPMRYPEVILCIEIYHCRRPWQKTQEFLVFGRQILTELRDNIHCLTDQLMQKAGQHDPSGYFLVEDMFCNDLRDPSAIDYSEPIFDWLRNSKDEARQKWEYIISGELQKKQKALLGDLATSSLPHFKAVIMHKTRFCDLRFRLGSGYLYCHQGDCKHILVIRDMRLIHPEDVQNQAAYPIRTFQLKPRYKKCSVCKIYVATKVTLDDKWAQFNPSYFCDNCYYLLHYTEDGSLLYNEFTVYDYYHDEFVYNESATHSRQ